MAGATARALAETAIAVLSSSPSATIVSDQAGNHVDPTATSQQAIQVGATTAAPDVLVDQSQMKQIMSTPSTSTSFMAPTASTHEDLFAGPSSQQNLDNSKTAVSLVQNWPLQGHNILDALFNTGGAQPGDAHVGGHGLELPTDAGHPGCEAGQDCLPLLTADGTGPEAEPSKDVTAGILAVIFAGIFFGSNFVPARSFPTGNGIFFQWTMCCGIFCTGLCLFALSGFPTVPKPHYAMGGGMAWCAGNLMAIPIISRIGIFSFWERLLQPSIFLQHQDHQHDRFISLAFSRHNKSKCKSHNTS